MTKSRYLFKNVNLLNILLITIIVFMTQYSVLPLLNIHINKYALPVPGKTLAQKDIPRVGNNLPSLSDYIVVSEANLFHPERKIPPDKKEEAQPLPKPDVVLYGTLIADDVSIAFVEDTKEPRNSAGRGKRQLALKKGDSLSGFTLKEIDVDKIMMVRGEETMTVSIYDPQKRKTKAATTTNAGPMAPSQPAAKSPISRSPAAKNRRPLTPADDRVMQFFERQKQ